MKRRILQIILIAAGAAALVAAAVGFFAWREYERCSETELAPEIIQKAVPPEKGIVIARRFEFTVKLKTPWARQLVTVEMEPGKGCQDAGDPVITLDSRSWGKLFWTVRIPVQTYVPGTIPSGRAVLVLEGGPELTRRVEVTLPSFTALPGNPDGQLNLADAMEIIPPEKKYGKYLIWGAAILIFAVFLVWLFLRRSSKAGAKTILPPWETALRSIEKLRMALSSGFCSPESAVVNLTDVVRHYVEDRFHFRAERQTTPEFLRDLDRDNGPLAQEHRSFLRDFLCSADMVKFAKLPADRSLFDHAAEKAEKLIRNTAQDKENAGKENAR